MSELLHLTLNELRDALHAKRASPVDLMNAVLARLDATRELLNAVVSVRARDALLAEARRAEARLWRGDGRPLEGIPLGVKDLEDVKGIVTSHGSVPFRDHVAECDSTQVARLRAAGAIVVGKTTAPEFGHTAITKNLLHGVTRSPWNPERTPGGSSGGSAAAIAGEVLPLVTASDGGGSIRLPASFTGAFGLKTSFGRIPKGPSSHWDHGATSVYGPLTKTVEDAAFFLDQVAGPDPFDPKSLPHPGLSYLDTVRRPLSKKLRIALSLDLGYAVVQSDIAAAIEQAARVFEDLGHRLTAIQGGPPQLGTDWALSTGFELAGRLDPLLPHREGDFSRAFIEGIRMAQGVTPHFWGEMSQRRAQLVQWVAELFSDYDLLLTPTVPYDPPPARGPFPSHTAGRVQPTASVAAFTIPFNLSWNPAATVRAGLSRAGLPIGMQIAGPQHRDDLVLQAARAFEREHPWHPAWPMR